MINWISSSSIHLIDHYMQNFAFQSHISFPFFSKILLWYWELLFWIIHRFLKSSIRSETLQSSRQAGTRGAKEWIHQHCEIKWSAATHSLSTGRIMEEIDINSRTETPNIYKTTIHREWQVMWLSVTAYVRTRRVGGSIVVTIPMEVVEIARIKEGETLKLEIDRPRSSYFGTLKGIGRINHEERMDHLD